jgi:hypothetical protein
LILEENRSKDPVHLAAGRMRLRGFFTKLADSTPQFLAIGSAEQVESGNPVIPVARRLSKPDGTFAGVIVADVDPNYFSHFFQGLDLGPGAICSAYRG